MLWGLAIILGKIVLGIFALGCVIAVLVARRIFLDLRQDAEPEALIDAANYVVRT